MNDSAARAQLALTDSISLQNRLKHGKVIGLNTAVHLPVVQNKVLKDL